MEIGQVCIKTKGREAGRKVVILSKVKEGKVLIDGAKVKRKNCNVMHLFPLKEKISVSADTKHEDLVKILGEKKQHKEVKIQKKEIKEKTGVKKTKKKGSKK